ncbi:MAG: S41 family peptidase [Gemmatimonadetes bacterium]|nr:S41 family peptidase [Gemmatimonadota bacterium]
MTIRRFPLGPGIVFGLGLAVGAWFLRQGVAEGQSTAVGSTLFDEVMDHVTDRYVDPMDTEVLYDSAIGGVLKSLVDPNTVLFSRESYENFRIQTEGDYSGVGLEIAERGDFVTVVGPIPGGPGQRAGIRAGDRLLAVEGSSASGWPVQQAVGVLRGEAGTSVHVQIGRDGVDEPIEFDLVREEIQLHAVPFATLLESGIGYVPLSIFSESSSGEVRAAADSLRRAGATSFVLDLRGNPGGILDQGVGIADLFLERGADVVETRGRDARPTGTLRASGGDRFPGAPVVVLVDRGSASASEIVAGALQDHDRALLIGSTTYGKGSVQTLFPLSAGNVLKLTTARWFTPQGRSIERDHKADAAAEAAAIAAGSPIGTLTIFGELTVPPDTAGRPTLTSVGGRTLFGGGGIVPDLLVANDTLSTVEQEAVRRLFAEGGRFVNGVFDFSVQFLNGAGNRNAGFEVTDADLERLYAWLRDERGIQVDVDTFRQAARFVRIDLESEIAQQGWGQLEAFRRGMPNDAALQRAIELLRVARSPGDLFTLAASPPLPGRSAATAGAGL